jgi:hypothetical protein
VLVVEGDAAAGRRPEPRLARLALDAAAEAGADGFVLVASAGGAPASGGGGFFGRGGGAPAGGGAAAALQAAALDAGVPFVAVKAAGLGVGADDFSGAGGVAIGDEEAGGLPAGAGAGGEPGAVSGRARAACLLLWGLLHRGAAHV